MGLVGGLFLRHSIVRGACMGLVGGLFLRHSIVRGACMGLAAVCFYGLSSFGGRVWAWSAVCFYGTSSFGGRVWAWRRFVSTALHRSGGVYGLGCGLFLRPSIVRGACMGLVAVCFYGTSSFGGRVWAWLRFAATTLLAQQVGTSPNCRTCSRQKPKRPNACQSVATRPTQQNETRTSSGPKASTALAC